MKTAVSCDVRRERIRWKPTHLCKQCKLRSWTQDLDPKDKKRGDVSLQKPTRQPPTGHGTFAITPSLDSLPHPTGLPPLQASDAAPLSSPCPTQLGFRLSGQVGAARAAPLSSSCPTQLGFHLSGQVGAAGASRRMAAAGEEKQQRREQRQNRCGGRPSARIGAMTEGRAGVVTRREGGKWRAQELYVPTIPKK
jgi:hypothetical protein